MMRRWRVWSGIQHLATYNLYPMGHRHRHHPITQQTTTGTRPVRWSVRIRICTTTCPRRLDITGSFLFSRLRRRQRSTANARPFAVVCIVYACARGSGGWRIEGEGGERREGVGWEACVAMLVADGESRQEGR